MIARGHNVAVFVPPVERSAAPLLRAVPRRPLLVLTADFTRAADLACLDDGLPGTVVRSGLATVAGDAVCYAAATDAADALGRSRFQPALFRALVLAWPEEFDDEATDSLEAVMAEADKEAQRLVLTATPGREVGALLERYAFKAMTFGFPPAEPSAAGDTAPHVGPARYVLAAPGDFGRTKALILDACGGLIEPSDIHRTPDSREAAASLVGGPRAPVIVADPRQLRWLRGLFAPLEPLALPGRLAASERRLERQREHLAALIEGQDLDRELAVIAPLLARYDAGLVAAAALRLAPQRVEGTSEPAGAVAAFTRIWVGVGRKDGVRPGDLVGALTGEAGIPADAVGKIEIRELFCLVEIGAQHAARAVAGLDGRTIRGRRVAARVDRGPTKTPPVGRRSRG